MHLPFSCAPFCSQQSEMHGCPSHEKFCSWFCSVFVLFPCFAVWYNETAVISQRMIVQNLCACVGNCDGNDDIALRLKLVKVVRVPKPERWSSDSTL